LASDPILVTHLQTMNRLEEAAQVVIMVRGPP
jgi:hypothetical protein